MDQIENAIEALYDPRVNNEIKNQANQYIESVKVSPEGWKISLELLLKQPKAAPHVRLFALQTIDYIFNNRFSQLPLEQTVWVKDTVWNYIVNTYLPDKEEEPLYIRTKLATSVATIFRQLYINYWQSFFNDLIILINGEFSIKATDFFLRVMKAIDEEVVNTTIFRGKDDVKLNTDVKDIMRERDLNILVPIWNQLILGYQSNFPEFSVMGLEIMGVFADWIDINLVVTDSFMTLIFQLLRSNKDSYSTPKLRIAACDCFIQIITKGMVVPDKIKLLEMFEVVELISTLILDDEEFIEHVSRLTNKIGLENFMIWKLVDKDSEAQVSAYAKLEKLVPYILKFLNNESEEISVNVFPIVNELLNLFKQQVNKMARPLTDNQNLLLSELLKAVITKSKFPQDFDWDDITEEEEEAQFGNIRKSLKVFFDSIAMLNRSIFDELVHAMVTTTFATNVTSETNWNDLELALRILHQYTQNSKTIIYLSDPNNSTSFNHLGDMVLKMAESNVLNCAHPSIAPAFYENVVRYHQFFELRPDLIPTILSSFLDQRGAYHDDPAVRRRVWYLLLRFAKLQKANLGKYVQNVVQALQQALIIQPDLHSDYKPGTPLNSTTVCSETFEYQLHLFETVSTVFGSAEQLDGNQKVELLTMILTPLITGIQNATSQAKVSIPDDPLFIVHLHHCIMAVGSVIKGLPERGRSDISAQPWVPLLKQCTEIILLSLEPTGHFSVIRDSARFTFSRMLHIVGSDILPYLIHLINGLMTSCEAVEMMDILPFLSQIAHTFSNEIYTIMNDLLTPTLEKTFLLLNKVPAGTDDAVMIVNLRKVYVSFLASLFNAKLEAVFRSEKNQATFPNILASLIHFCKDHGNLTVQKLSFNILTKMVETWLPTQSVTTTTELNNDGIKAPIPDQFYQQFRDFTLQQILPVTFEVPMVRTFDLQDGQSVMVIGEITNLQQAMLKTLGSPFLEYLNLEILNQINCPPNFRLQLFDALQTLDNKNYKKYYQSFILESRAWVQPSS